MSRSGVRIPVEALISLRARLATLTARNAGRAEEIARVAELYGGSPSSVYRQLRELHRPKGLRRADRGSPRAMSSAELERYCQIVVKFQQRYVMRHSLFMEFISEENERYYSLLSMVE